MTKKTKLSRRRFVAVNAAAAGVACAMPGQASMAPVAGVPARPLAADWGSAGADELAQFVGDRFRIRTSDGTPLVLELKSVEPVNSGPDRPAGLSRREGVIAVFDSPDKAPLVDHGAGVHRIEHLRLGSAQFFMSPVPRRGGGHVIELSLN